jgi:hypothetical protein
MFSLFPASLIIYETDCYPEGKLFQIYVVYQGIFLQVNYFVLFARPFRLNAWKAFEPFSSSSFCWSYFLQQRGVCVAV